MALSSSHTKSPEFDSWFEGKEFTTDWLSSKLSSWMTALGPLRSKPGAAILEIGSFEGRSAVALLEMFPGSRLTAVDLWPQSLAQHEARFDRNMAPYGDRCVKIKASAYEALRSIVRTTETFDVIYLDAAKRRDDAVAMSALCWSALKVNGVMIIDDLTWKPSNAPAERPQQGIELFLKAFAPALQILHKGSQVIFRKRADWPG